MDILFVALAWITVGCLFNYFILMPKILKKHGDHLSKDGLLRRLIEGYNPIKEIFGDLNDELGGLLAAVKLLTVSTLSVAIALIQGLAKAILWPGHAWLMNRVVRRAVRSRAEILKEEQADG